MTQPNGISPAAVSDSVAGVFPAPPTGAQFRAADAKKVAIFGMSGVGKTWIAKHLRDTRRWFHYSVDYRIGTRYLGELIVDDFKREAMKSPLLKEMLLSDSIYISSNIAFENLKPLSFYLGKPGAPAQGGLPFEEYVRRQREHRAAERAAMLDSLDFAGKAHEIYGYRNFLCDASGSLVEIVDPTNPDDEILKQLSAEFIFVQIETDEKSDEALARRFDRDPKPIYYNEDFLRELWAAYQLETGCAADGVDPNDFIRWGFRRLIARRRAGYGQLAENWGVSVPRAAIEAAAAEAGLLPSADSDVKSDVARFEARLTDLIAAALDARAGALAGSAAPAPLPAPLAESAGA